MEIKYEIEDQEATQQRDELFELSSDLVSMCSHEDLLQRLFQREAGNWESLA